MGSSGASTPAGRRRSAERERAAKSPQRKRSAGAHKAAPKAKATTAKPKPKPKTAAAKPKRPSPTARKRAKPTPAKPRVSASNAINIAFVVLALGVILAGAYFFWFRDSKFVAIENVTVDGIEGPEAPAVTKALTQSAEKMTTLNVDESELATAVSRYSTVISIQTESDFPHGLTIHVASRPPVMNATEGDHSVPVAADGTLLPGVDTSEADIPSVAVADLPASGKVTGDSLEVATIAGAAPAPLLLLIEKLTASGESGVEVTLKGGIPVIFGDSDQAAQKWDAVSAILANPKVKTLTHLDVRVPERPSIGGAAPPLQAGQ